MYNLIICGVFKNEAHILDEWIRHYKYHGVEHIYLVNDNSTDNCKDILERYIIDGYVTLFQNDIETSNIGRQIMIYDNYFKPLLNTSKWIAILDLDEFLYSPHEINLLNIIEQYNNYAQIQIDWLHFGSSGHIYQPQSVVEGFQQRALDYNSKPYYAYKTIFKASQLISFDIHSHNVDGQTIHLKYDINTLPQLLINHYCIQSLDFWMKVKASRGDINKWFDNNNLIRDHVYFKNYDINEYNDDILYKQNKNIINTVKNNKISNEDEVTLIITSCNRPQLLKDTLKSFIKFNTFPIKETYIIEDSGVIGCNDSILFEMKDDINNLKLKIIYNDTNIGQLASIDKVYSYVTTKYIFHCEEDWEFLQPGFIEKSLEIFKQNPDEKIYTVWLRPHNCTSGHPIMYDTLNKGYYKMKPDFSYVDKGETYTWCGATFNPGLRKTQDCLSFHPYTIKCKKSLKNGKEYVGEYSLNCLYRDSNYYCVILADPRGHVNHIGWNQHIPRHWD
jgi:hypothetical protein